jgi:hypothetical protein
MAINSVSSNNSSQVSSIKQSVPQPVSAEVRGKKENESDDGASSKINAAKPTVNTSGQTIGNTISVAA